MARFAGYNCIRMSKYQVPVTAGARAYTCAGTRLHIRSTTVGITSAEATSNIDLTSRSFRTNTTIGKTIIYLLDALGMCTDTPAAQLAMRINFANWRAGAKRLITKCALERRLLSAVAIGAYSAPFGRADRCCNRRGPNIPIRTSIRAGIRGKGREHSSLSVSVWRPLGNPEREHVRYIDLSKTTITYHSLGDENPKQLRLFFEFLIEEKRSSYLYQRVIGRIVRRHFSIYRRVTGN